MAVFPTTYQFSVATAVGPYGVYTTNSNNLSYTELSGGSYARQACGFSGNAVSGLTQAVSAFVVATAPTPAVPILYGMILDTSVLVTGNVICYWELAQPYTTSLTAYPATTFNVTFNTYVSQALNLASLGGAGSSGSLIDAGAQIGLVNGQPLRAGCRLGINSAGSLVPHVATGTWMSGADVQNQLNFGALATNSINNGITALAGGGTSGAVPTLSGFFNRITTSASSGDSCILPGPLFAPVGSMLCVVNNGVSISNVFADVGASVNVASTLTVAVGVGKACIFTRITPVLWSTIPAVPS